MPKSLSFTTTIVTITILILTFLFLRLLYILPSTNPRRPLPRKRGSPTHLLIVLGSGGHTAEMFALLADLDLISYNYRTYVVSKGDEFSALRAEEFERELVTKCTSKPAASSSPPSFSASPLSPPSPSSYKIHTIPRARLIHQSLLTTLFTSLSSLLASISLLTTSPSSSFPSSPPSSSFLPTYPDLILLNGPATSVIVLLAALLVRFFDWRGTTRGKMRTIYIESWARVKRLSLSARVITAVGGAERVLVQWEGLAARGRGQTEFRGCLIR